jgi:hypothetical protein
LTDHVTLGVLSSVIHRDVVDDVIRETGKREERSRLLPAHVVVYYVLALNLFFGEAYEEVMRQLVNGLRFLGNWRGHWKVPTTSAISQARARLGEAPLKLLFARIAVPMARPGTRGAWFHGLRVMAIDGLVLDVADTPDNDEEFGRSGNDTAPSPFPQVRLVALGECGTHAAVDAALGPVTTGEKTLTTELIARFAPGMLVLADRNFYSYQAWQQAVATGAALLWRVSATLTLPVLAWLPDGSYRSVLINPKIRGRRRQALITAAAAGADLDPDQAMVVRVVEYMIDDRPGSGELFSPDHHDHRPRVRPRPRARRGLSRTLGNRAVLRRDRNPPNRPPPSTPIQNPGTGQTRDLVTTADPLRDTPRHERRRRHRRHRPRQLILHTQLPRDPPPGHQPGGFFPLKDSPQHSKKPPTKSSNDPTRHAETAPTQGWSKGTARTATASNELPITAKSTTAQPRSTSSRSRA